MKIFLKKFFRVFFILWGVFGIGAIAVFSVSLLGTLAFFWALSDKENRENFGGDFDDVAFIFDSGVIEKSNFDSVEYRYDSARSFTGDGVSIYTVKTKNLDPAHLDKNFWFKPKEMHPVISEAISFLKGCSNMPDINLEGENMYIAPLFIRKYSFGVTDAALLVYDAKNERIYYLNVNI